MLVIEIAWGWCWSPQSAKTAATRDQDHSDQQSMSCTFVHETKEQVSSKLSKGFTSTRPWVSHRIVCDQRAVGKAFSHEKSMRKG